MNEVTQPKITKDMPIQHVLETYPQTSEILMEAGLGCIGCPFSQQETIEQGFSVHGMDSEEIDEIVEQLNAAR